MGTHKKKKDQGQAQELYMEFENCCTENWKKAWNSRPCFLSCFKGCNSVSDIKKLTWVVLLLPTVCTEPVIVLDSVYALQSSADQSREIQLPGTKFLNNNYTESKGNDIF